MKVKSSRITGSEAAVGCVQRCNNELSARKRTVYACESVSYFWLENSDTKSLEAIELRGTEWLLIDTLFDITQISLTPFEAISFNLLDS